MTPIEVVYDARTYRVDFAREWHTPPKDGRIRPQRIRQTTLCVIDRLDDAGQMEARWTGQAHCSVADRYVPMVGLRLALNRACDRLGDGNSAGIWNVFARTVLPVLAADPKNRTRRQAPPRPAKLLDQLLGQVAHALAALTYGEREAVRRYLARDFQIATGVVREIAGLPPVPAGERP